MSRVVKGSADVGRGDLASNALSLRKTEQVGEKKELESGEARAREGSSAEEEVSRFILDSSRLLSQELQGKLLEAHEERRKGELARANILCDEIIASDPEAGEAYIIKAQTVINTNLKESLWYLEKALSLNMKRDNIGDRAEIYSYISGILLKLDRYEDAVIAAQSATELEPLNEEYIQIKNIASLKLRLYINSLATNEAGEDMKIKEAIELVKVRIDNLKAGLSEESLSELMSDMAKLEEVGINALTKKRIMDGLQVLSNKIDGFIGMDAALKELDSHPSLTDALLRVEPEISVISNEAAGGAGAENVEQIAESSIPAGGAGGVTAISASGGASSILAATNAAYLAQRPEEEYFLAAKAAIESFSMSEAEVKREIAKIVATHTKTPDEIYSKIEELRKAGNWDELCFFMKTNKEQISLDHIYLYIQYGVGAKNFKVFYTMIALYPVLKEYFAAEVLNKSFNGKKQSEEQIELEIKYLKEVEEKIKELGIDDNKAICANRDAGKLVWGVLEHAAYIVSDDEGRIIKHNIFEHFINKLTTVNFKIDKLTAVYVMRQLRDVSHFMKDLCPLLEDSSEEYYDDILDAVYQHGIYANNYTTIIGESSIGADE